MPSINSSAPTAASRSGWTSSSKQPAPSCESAPATASSPRSTRS
jgi:hypothetical protein